MPFLGAVQNMVGFGREHRLTGANQHLVQRESVQTIP